MMSPPIFLEEHWSFFDVKKKFRPRRASTCRIFGQNDPKIYRFSPKIDLFCTFSGLSSPKSILWTGNAFKPYFLPASTRISVNSFWGISHTNGFWVFLRSLLWPGNSFKPYFLPPCWPRQSWRNPVISAGTPLTNNCIQIRGGICFFWIEPLKWS